MQTNKTIEDNLKTALQILIEIAKAKLTVEEAEQLRSTAMECQNCEQLSQSVVDVAKLNLSFFGNRDAAANDEEYKKLELSLQILEGKERSYIQRENQMKLYCQELEDKVNELQTAKHQLVVSTKKAILDLKRDNQNLVAEVRTLKATVMQSHSAQNVTQRGSEQNFTQRVTEQSSECKRNLSKQKTDNDNEQQKDKSRQRTLEREKLKQCSERNEKTNEKINEKTNEKVSGKFAEKAEQRINGNGNRGTNLKDKSKGKEKDASRVKMADAVSLKLSQFQNAIDSIGSSRKKPSLNELRDPNVFTRPFS